MTLDDIKRQAMEKSLGMANSGLSNADLEMLYWESVINAEPVEPIDTSTFATKASLQEINLALSGEIERIDGVAADLDGVAADHEIRLAALELPTAP